MADVLCVERTKPDRNSPLGANCCNNDTVSRPAVGSVEFVVGQDRAGGKRSPELKQRGPRLGKSPEFFSAARAPKFAVRFARPDA
jgi:hypothetical protein